LLDIDPVGLVRGRGEGSGLLDQYVNDRPYVASSFLSVAIAEVFGSALNGRSRERPELAATPIPLAAFLPALPTRGGADIIRRLFTPLDYEMEIAEHPLDPWSGHMAFPGGRVDPEDGNPKQAAERETLEEVGLELRDAEWIGRLDDRQGNPRLKHALLISAFVYVVPQAAPLTLNHEVREAFWFPLAELLEPARFVERPVARSEIFRFPGILVGEPERHVVWGLTYRFLESFFQIVGRPFPDRWQAGVARAQRAAGERSS
jgi:8-oxo-dGTP pyrophosphatase MutT (NUDIX family)